MMKPQTSTEQVGYDRTFAAIATGLATATFGNVWTPTTGISSQVKPNTIRQFGLFHVMTTAVAGPNRCYLEINDGDAGSIIGQFEFNPYQSSLFLPIGFCLKNVDAYFRVKQYSGGASNVYFSCMYRDILL